MKTWRFVFLLILLQPYLSLAGEINSTASNDCSSGWREIDWKMAPFPDLDARYFSYQIRIRKGQKIQLKIEGDFPIARYMSYHVYNQLTEDPTSHIVDSNIVPDVGSVNPYQPGVDRYSSNRHYTLWVTQSQEEPAGEQKLVLPYDEKQDRFVDIWFRVYVSEEKKISLPKIFAFDLEKKATACPELTAKKWSIATEAGPLGFRVPSPSLKGREPLPFKNGEVHFFRPATGSLGANLDNGYTSTRLDGKALFDPSSLKGRIEQKLLKKYNAIQNIGNVTVLKFRTPTFPNTLSHLKYFTGNEEVRFWSLCLSEGDTSTSECLLDSNVKTFTGRNGEEYAVVVIGPEDKKLRQSVLTAGYNFLNHSQLRVPLLFYRQMLARPDFVGSVVRVIPIPPEKAESAGPFDSFFGEGGIGDYSPVGKQCWLTENFISTLCGFDLEN